MFKLLVLLFTIKLYARVNVFKLYTKVHVEKDIYLKKVFPEKSIIAFHKIKSIRNYIVRTDVKEANDQKKPKTTTPCYSCRKTCHLISGEETLKNIHNGKEIK